MADGKAAGAPGDMGSHITADHACRNGRRTAVGTLDLLAQLAESGAGARQAAVAARAIGADVDAELDRLAAARLDAA